MLKAHRLSSFSDWVCWYSATSVLTNLLLEQFLVRLAVVRPPQERVVEGDGLYGSQAVIEIKFRPAEVKPEQFQAPEVYAAIADVEILRFVEDQHPSYRVGVHAGVVFSDGFEQQTFHGRKLCLRRGKMMKQKGR
jgi:hypothetical protein